MPGLCEGTALELPLCATAWGGVAELQTCYPTTEALGMPETSGVGARHRKSG
jgi:hypothetical protein